MASTGELSIKLTEVVNFIVGMCTIPIICAGILLFRNESYQYIDWLSFPVLFILWVGIFFLFVSLASLDRKQPGDLVVFLLYTAFLIVILVIVVVLVFVIVAPSGAYSVQDRAYKEYRLSGFSHWMRNYVDWDGRRNVIEANEVCLNLNEEFNKYNNSAQRFFASHLSPVESGCCKPPTVCGYYYINPILWVNPENTSADSDCSRWNNSDTYKLCYDCDSCKAGILGNIRHEWIKANVILTVVLVVLICMFVIAYRAYKNGKTEYLFRSNNYKQGWFKLASPKHMTLV